MKTQIILLSILLVSTLTFAADLPLISEVVYVESPTDTDSDGKPDRIYVSIQRSVSDKKLPSIYEISPYAQGGNNVDMHKVDFDLLPQDEAFLYGSSSQMKNFIRTLKKPLQKFVPSPKIDAPQYAQITAHSLGTGNSTGCPTVGDMSETLAAKSVIDWLNNRARAFYADGREAKADWSNGAVGMTGVSYNGTLPTMVATTGVEGLKAIIPVAAISSWYDYYRSNGLVVSPGGYEGEDADVLGKYIVRRNACKNEIANITATMGRENGDFTRFWQDRDYIQHAGKIKAATFIIHGQSDWNVKQRHAINLWNAIEGVVPRRMHLHRGGHASAASAQAKAWFDHFVAGEPNDIVKGPQVEVVLPDGKLMVQEEWPHEETTVQRFYLASENALSRGPELGTIFSMMDAGKTQKIDSLMSNPTQANKGRLVFLTAPTTKEVILSGTSVVSLNFAVMNRKAANLTVAIIEYDKNGRGKIITRGWADAQNHRGITEGELLVPGQNYQISFELEPKQYKLAAGSRLGVLVASTYYDYTIRPKAGTEIKVNAGELTYIEMNLSSGF